MPELPEVETTRRGIQPYVENQKVSRVIVRDRRLRWPIPEELEKKLEGATPKTLSRRSKYLVFEFETGHMIVHLGMSGSLRICQPDEPPSIHDHVDVVMESGHCIRYRDPRRFGCFLWTSEPLDEHKLIRNLGPEPLTRSFSGEGLHQLSRGRKIAVKNFIMDAHIVVGVGNIYANEALYHAGIMPTRQAGRISLQRYQLLASEIKKTLKRSIRLGGTTLRDFVNSDGNPGYFEQTLAVYGREGKGCRNCGSTIKRKVVGQRSTFYCSQCQT